MAAPGAALRDPVFYRWHKSIDEIFELNKVMLPPYELKQVSEFMFLIVLLIET